MFETVINCMTDLAKIYYKKKNLSLCDVYYADNQIDIIKPTTNSRGEVIQFIKLPTVQARYYNISDPYTYCRALHVRYFKRLKVPAKVFQLIKEKLQLT